MIAYILIVFAAGVALGVYLEKKEVKGLEQYVKDMGRDRDKWKKAYLAKEYRR